MVPSFIHLASFTKNWRAMKLGDNDLRGLEILISRGPGAPPVMRGTGGLRKMRFAPPGRSTGKSGAVRVCYAYFPEFELVYLCAAFEKSAMANLTNAEAAAYRVVLEQFSRYLRLHHKRGWTP